jgi:hypothetical protein
LSLGLVAVRVAGRLSPDLDSARHPEQPVDAATLVIRVESGPFFANADLAFSSVDEAAAAASATTDDAPSRPPEP